MAAPMASMPTLTLEQAREALTMAHAALTTEATEAAIKAAVDAAAGDMMKIMATAVPVALGALGPTLTKFGFSPDQMGGMMFVTALRAHSSDPEILAGVNDLQARLMPGIPLPGAAGMGGRGAGSGGAPTS
uniref:Protein C10 n=1 Tax=Bicosoecida sp. CB-2014 TaxID=1486930 RepID=A0A7S1C7F2_9STRA|mmetsp:Transcript_14742/g.51333  ORF Transcript_14742/g.51333 Transcript_14742/m.51333 type:complete len:131 (+) Transcript_14742:208-600(+)